MQNKSMNHTPELTIQTNSQQKRVRTRSGSTFLSAAMSARVAIPTRCGGKGSCGTCKIIVVDSQIPLQAPTPKEQRLVSESDLQAGYRLACQTKITGDAVIKMPESPLQRLINQQLKST